MKNTKRNLKLLAYSLCLAAAMYNCKKKDDGSVTPVTYTFPGLENVKLPDVTPTAPAAVTTTPATFSIPAQAVAVSSSLQSIASTGKVPDAVQQAAADMSKAVSADQAASLSAKFTPDVINNIATTGLPADLKTNVTAIAANPAVKAYLPTYTLPQVNGKAVGGRVNAVTTLAVAHSVTDAGEDACKKAANDAYNSLIPALDQTRQTQTATINTAYSQAEAAALAEVPSCQSGVPAKYSKLVSDAKANLDVTIANLTAARSVLGEVMFNQLTIWAYIAYSQTISTYATLQAAELNACTALKDAKIASAKAARDIDLNTVNTNYNTVLKNAQAARDKAIASCHNQGNGG